MSFFLIEVVLGFWWMLLALRHSPQHPTKQKLAASATKQSFQGTSNTTTGNTQLQERSKEDSIGGTDPIKLYQEAGKEPSLKHSMSRREQKLRVQKIGRWWILIPDSQKGGEPRNPGQIMNLYNCLINSSLELIVWGDLKRWTLNSANNLCSHFSKRPHIS